MEEARIASDNFSTPGTSGPGPGRFGHVHALVLDRSTAESSWAQMYWISEASETSAGLRAHGRRPSRWIARAGGVGAAVAALVAMTVVAPRAHGAMLYDSSVSPAVPAASATVPPAPTAVEAVPYAGGRAYVSWAAGSGTESDSYRVETYQVTSRGLVDDGGVSAVGVDAVVGGLTVGSTYQFSVSALNAYGSGAAASTNAINAVGLLAPGSPSAVRLVSDGVDNQLTLSWTPSQAAPAAEKYNVGVFEGSGSSLHQVGAVTCDAPCSSQVIQATPGTVTSADVIAANTVGTANPVWGNTVQVPQPCPLACVTLASANPGGPFGHPSDGFLVPGGPTTAGTLAPEQWRTNAATLAAMTPVDLASMHGSAVTEILSDDWVRTHNVAGYAVTPWSNWAAYSSWVTSEVSLIESMGRQQGFTVSYWDIQNEPFGGYYYSNSSLPPASETTSAFETQFLVAYRAIKAADPNAQVVGPSMISFAANPADTSGIDLRTFLDFAVANGITLGAVSFHDNNFAGSSGWYEPQNAPAAQPAEVQGHIAQLRQLVAQRPSLGHPVILVNEYGDPYTYQVPGWDVGRIAALDGAGVDGANRSCWSDCAASLDGLLTPDGLSTLAGYWVYAFYSGMSGSTVPVRSSYTDVTGLASVDSAGQVEALLGRHQSCVLISIYCPAPPAQSATVSVQVPNAATVQVTMTLIPAGSSLTAPLASVVPTTSTVQVTGGSATFDTPALHDGDAVKITVTPLP